MRVTFLPAAENDLGSLYLYIKEELHNEIAARNITTKILQRARDLASFSEIGVSLGNVASKLEGYRYLIIDNYILIYKVADEVRIVRILYARSDYVQLLQD